LYEVTNTRTNNKQKKSQIYTGFSTKIKYLNRIAQTVNYLK